VEAYRSVVYFEYELTQNDLLNLSMENYKSELNHVMHYSHISAYFIFYKGVLISILCDEHGNVPT